MNKIYEIDVDWIYQYSSNHHELQFPIKLIIIAKDKEEAKNIAFKKLNSSHFETWSAKKRYSKTITIKEISLDKPKVITGVYNRMVWCNSYWFEFL